MLLTEAIQAGAGAGAEMANMPSPGGLLKPLEQRVNAMIKEIREISSALTIKLYDPRQSGVRM